MRCTLPLSFGQYFLHILLRIADVSTIWAYSCYRATRTHTLTHTFILNQRIFIVVAGILLCCALCHRTAAIAAVAAVVVAVVGVCIIHSAMFIYTNIPSLRHVVLSIGAFSYLGNPPPENCSVQKRAHRRNRKIHSRSNSNGIN